MTNELILADNALTRAIQALNSIKGKYGSTKALNLDIQGLKIAHQVVKNEQLKERTVA